MKYPVDLTVNGRACHVEVEARALLIDILREQLGLTGVHTGCENATCGACTVLCDGKTLKACTRLAVQADGAAIVTLEGLSGVGAPTPDALRELHPLQEACAASRVLPCGFCAAGRLLVAWEALQREPEADEAALRRALSGAHCPCADSERLVAAALEAARRSRVEAPSIEEPA